jgi:hypothetical protein
MSAAGSDVDTGLAGDRSASTGVLMFATALVMVPMLLRASIGFTAIAGWDLDPFAVAVPNSALTPAWSMVCDAVAMLGAAGLIFATRGIWAATRSGRTSAIFGAAVVLAVMGVVAFHGWFGAAASLGQQRIGASWASAFACGLAVLLGARDGRVRAVVMGLMLGFLGLLAARGSMQVFVENPATLESFRRNREAILTANGWAADSISARLYERRISGWEATAWFGLGNVYASLSAAGVCFGAVLTVMAARMRAMGGGASARGVLVAGLGVLLIALAGLVMTNAKGGYGAAGIGLFAAAVLGVLASIAQRVGWGARARVLAWLVAPGAVLGVLGIVTLRGMIGERLGELSLLFRWWYMQAAVRVFGQSPVLGVGPDGFRDAYAFAKNPLNPEEISSPHSMMFDWGAGLGVAGVLAGVWVVWMLARATSCAMAGDVGGDVGGGMAKGIATLERDERLRDEGEPERDSEQELTATLGKAAGLIAAAVVLAGAYIEREGTSAPAAMARLLGLIVWVVLAWAIVRMCRACTGTDGSAAARPVALAMASAGVALMAHGQIEVTPGWTQSAGFFVMFVALAASTGSAHAAGNRRDEANAPRVGRSGMLPAAIAMSLLAAAAGLAFGVSRVFVQERELQQASAMARTVGEARMLLASAMSERDARARDQMLAELVEIVGKPDGSVGIDRLVAAAESRVLGPTAEALERAADMVESWAVRREASRVLLRWAMDGATPPQRRGELLERALRIVALPSDEAMAIDRVPKVRWGGVALRLGWSATVAQAAAGIPGQDRRAWLARAEGWLVRAGELERHSPDLAAELLRVREEILRSSDPAGPTYAQDRQRVRDAAIEALRRDDLQRLDPMRRLPPGERTRIERIVAEP